MKKRILLTSVLILFIFAINLRAQDDFDKSRLDDYLHQLEKNNKAMCGVAIGKDGKLVYEHYIGFASVDENIRNNSLTKFRIGSITKIFTAAVIFQLIEEGRLTLDTKLSEFYPRIQNSKDITIAYMLGHRSGIHNFTDDKEYAEYMTAEKSKDEMVEIFANLKADFQPDEKYAYSNSNYVLLGYIIEKVTDLTYRLEIKKRITDKINLSGTYYGNKINTEFNEAASYRFREEKWNVQPETDMSIPHGAGAIVSTPNDLIVLITALFTNKIISENSVNQMKEIKDGYGKGLIRFPFGERKAYGHNGGIDGFVSNVAYFPDEKVAIAVTANGMNYNFNNILIGILSIYFNVPFEIPDFSVKAIKIDIDELGKYAGEFSSKNLPLKITLKVKSGRLYGQATGQSEFPLTPFSKTEFGFEQAGIIIEFAKDNKGEMQYDSFILNQGGGKFPFEKD